MKKEGPRIGVIGAGAIGGFYGGLLARAGLDVHFLLRSEYAEVAERGIRIESDGHGEIRLERVSAYRRVEDMPSCDWLLVGTKAVSNAALAPTLSRIAAPGARIVVMQNGLDVEAELRPLLPAEVHLIGGPCYTAVEHLGPGRLRHLAYAGIHLGYHSGPATAPAQRNAILQESVDFFVPAGIDARIVPDLPSARWQKLMWNIPFNGLSVLLACGSAELVGNADTCKLAWEMMQEVARAAQCCGCPLPPESMERTMMLARALPNYLPSMVFDHRMRRPMELGPIYEAPLRAARRAGTDMPKVEGLYRALKFIDARNASPAKN